MSNLIVAPALIGIHGLKGSGKDSVALYLHNSYQNTWREAFADALKDSCSAMFGIPRHEFDDRELKEQIVYPWGITRRQMLQFFGTEMVREQIGKILPEVGEAFWLTRLAYRLQNFDDVVYDAEDRIVIPDVRFQNEYDWIIENNGIVIHLTRPSAGVIIDPHASEQPINLHTKEQTYELVNDGTLEELYLKVDKILDSQSYISFIRKQISGSEII